MTEQEAEALAERLTRIWKGQLVSPVKRWNEAPETLTAEVEVNGYRTNLHHINDQEIYLRPDSDAGGHRLSYYFDGLIVLYSEGEEDPVRRSSQQRIEQVWLPFFRRGCWLSGCPIEASAHEKTEWMQGFSREELQTWNLKF